MIDMKFMKKTFLHWAILIVALFFTLNINAQYTYTTESFEGSVFSNYSVGSSGGANVNSTTGQWFVAKATVRQDSPNAYDGTNSVESGGSQFQMISPVLNEGAKQLTFYGFGNSAKPVTVFISPDGKTYTDIPPPTANFSGSWKLYSIDINSTTTKYVKLTSTSGGVVVDKILIT